jgi:hypothetical protein
MDVPPLLLVNYDIGVSLVNEMDKLLQDHEELMKEFKLNLQRSNSCMKQQGLLKVAPISPKHRIQASTSKTGEPFFWAISSDSQSASSSLSSFIADRVQNTPCGPRVIIKMEVGGDLYRLKGATLILGRHRAMYGASADSRLHVGIKGK